MEMLDQLNALAKQGRQINVEWCCVADDDIMMEFTEDMASEVTALQFQIKVIDSPDM